MQLNPKFEGIFFLDYEELNLRGRQLEETVATDAL